MVEEEEEPFLSTREHFLWNPFSDVQWVTLELVQDHVVAMGPGPPGLQHNGWSGLLELVLKPYINSKIMDAAKSAGSKGRNCWRTRWRTERCEDVKGRSMRWTDWKEHGGREWKKRNRSKGVGVDGWGKQMVNENDMGRGAQEQKQAMQLCERKQKMGQCDKPSCWEANG